MNEPCITATDIGYHVLIINDQVFMEVEDRMEGQQNDLEGIKC